MKIEFDLPEGISLGPDDLEQIRYVFKLGMLDVAAAMRWRESHEMGPPPGQTASCSWFEALAVRCANAEVRIAPMVEAETEVKLTDVTVEPLCNGWAVYVPPHLPGNRLQGWYADEEEAGRVALRYQRQLNERGGS